MDLGSATDNGTALHRSVNALIEGSNDPEWVVRYAAVFGLEHRLDQKSLQPNENAMAVRCLHRCADIREGVRVVRCRARLALQRLALE